MSFSSDVKEELLKNNSHIGKSGLPELASAIVFGEAGLKADENLVFSSEHIPEIKRYVSLLKRSLDITPRVCVRTQTGSRKPMYYMEISGKKTINYLLSVIRVGKGEEGFYYRGNPEKMSNQGRFAYIRGAFIMQGSVNDPAKSYHFEIKAPNRKEAETLAEILKPVSEEVKISQRNGSSFVYIKDSNIISDTLAAMGAAVSVMNYENVKIINETRGMINRRVNCEVGNIKKTADACRKQIESILYIKEVKGLESLPENLRKMAYLRISNPEASFTELGEMSDPPLGKSGVSHRLARIIKHADELKQLEESVNEKIK